MRLNPPNPGKIRFNRPINPIGIGLISARGYYLKPEHQGEFIFGYSQLDETQIEEGIFKLSQIL
ncbi:MAG: hypothetical protein AB4372_14865 [Xenococcus sp. (in: cyanobacteria)]|nr:hypothetical protein [Xenococcaceae cyanobacterium MO_167.B52]